VNFAPPNPRSVLLITLDSCRYDTFAAAHAPNIRRVGPLHRAQAPACFTYASHAAMFVGFTPSDPTNHQPYVNTQTAKVFRMFRGGGESTQVDYVELHGRNIIDGFRRVGFATIGTGAMGWFNPEKETSRPLMQDFEKFWYAGNGRSLRKQLEFVASSLANVGAAQSNGWFGRRKPVGSADRPVFLFINVGETHMPYWHEGADWDRKFNPCLPFVATSDAAECRRRQAACLEFADTELAPLLDTFLSAGATVLVCGDHGDCWGEDGAWGHGFSHPKVHEVPLLMRLSATNPLQ
jgi:hypothetical protein